MAHHSAQGVYAPLPQSISDSDSEKELHMESICSNNHTKTNQQQNGVNKYDKINRHHNSPTISSSTMNFMQFNDDLIEIKTAPNKPPRMSLLRKIAFILSIILCFLPIIIFLWILPCSLPQTCNVKTTNWENKQEDVELKGPINLVHGLNQNNLNLAILFRGNLLPSSTPSPSLLNNGAVSFLGTSGSVAWYF